jgi:hypothetical protein
MAFNLYRTLDGLHRSLHAFLAPRGWTLDGHGPDLIPDDFDFASYPTWRYTSSYGGVKFNVETDVTPDDLICTIESSKDDNDPYVVEVEPSATGTAANDTPPPSTTSRSRTTVRTSKSSALCLIDLNPMPPQATHTS